ncbi:hypothetical protein AMELA_G00253930 [Ameiurus melas]|uniref:Uncharacterized protein n=1 Tax=Ameiurus melas TaxID=219545 RepID=A0A7J5ZQZ5_AMEME|nr:hypothetical protein AMELA_G00253930 [Ameiurus melas]
MNVVIISPDEFNQQKTSQYFYIHRNLKGNGGNGNKSRLREQPQWHDADRSVSRILPRPSLSSQPRLVRTSVPPK